MTYPPGSDHDPSAETTDPVDPPNADDVVTDRVDVAPDADPPTEVFGGETTASPEVDGGERRFTAPGFDASETQVLPPPPEDPATEVFHPESVKATPQAIPARSARVIPPSIQQHWGWVLALTLIVLALAAIAVLGTVLMSRENKTSASQEDWVRSTIDQFDTAVQTGDLTTLRSITCGTTRDRYVNYDDEKWAALHAKVKKAARYPMVASIDEVVINGEHAEANVTAYMAYAPAKRSVRSFDLQFRDDQWKICQAPMG